MFRANVCGVTFYLDISTRTVRPKKMSDTYKRYILLVPDQLMRPLTRIIDRGTRLVPRHFRAGHLATQNNYAVKTRFHRSGLCGDGQGLQRVFGKLRQRRHAVSANAASMDFMDRQRSDDARARRQRGQSGCEDGRRVDDQRGNHRGNRERQAG